MTAVIDFDEYRVETYRGPGACLTATSIQPRVRIVRTRDGAWLGMGEEVDTVYRLLWERANGTPEEETKKWAPGWVEWFVSGADREDFWERAAKAAEGSVRGYRGGAGCLCPTSRGPPSAHHVRARVPPAAPPPQCVEGLTRGSASYRASAIVRRGET